MHTVSNAEFEADWNDIASRLGDYERLDMVKIPFAKVTVLIHGPSHSGKRSFINHVMGLPLLNDSA